MSAADTAARDPVWRILTILFLLALVLVHLWWRRRYVIMQEVAVREKAALHDELQLQKQQVAVQQQALFNSMMEGVLLLDDADRVQLANRAFSTLFDLSGELRGKTILEVLRRHELVGLLERVRSEKSVLGYELTLAGTEERVLEINAAVVMDGGGTSRGNILIFHDLTRLKQLERTREEFVANVSHELRTPLSLIKGYVETLLDGAKDNPEVSTKFLQTIQRNSERLQFLIEDLLTISELESGRAAMDVQPVQLRPLVQRVLADFESQAAARSVILKNDVPEMMALADTHRLQQVLGNLVGNAIKYGRVGGVVNLAARERGNEIEVCVQDDGPGIPEPALERVFERFYRVDKGRSREQGGTGLGLAIVKHIVQSHGGRVWVTSASGSGAAFYFTLPRNRPTKL